MNATEIVKKIREYDNVEMFKFTLPDIYEQIAFIQEQLDAGIKIIVVNAPVVLTKDNTAISMKSWKMDGKIEVPEGTRTILIYGWFELGELIDRNGEHTGLNQGQLFRGHFSEKDIEIDEN